MNWLILLGMAVRELHMSPDDFWNLTMKEFMAITGNMYIENGIRSLRKLSYGREFEEVREDLSTDSTYRLPAEVEFTRRSITRHELDQLMQQFS